MNSTGKQDAPTGAAMWRGFRLLPLFYLIEKNTKLRKGGRWRKFDEKKTGYAGAVNPQTEKIRSKKF